jgi:hypothetical protein
MGMKERYCGLMAIKATNTGHAKGLWNVVSPANIAKLSWMKSRVSI